MPGLEVLQRPLVSGGCANNMELPYDCQVQLNEPLADAGPGAAAAQCDSVQPGALAWRRWRDSRPVPIADLPTAQQQTDVARAAVVEPQAQHHVVAAIDDRPPPSPRSSKPAHGSARSSATSARPARTSWSTPSPRRWRRRLAKRCRPGSSSVPARSARATPTCSRARTARQAPLRCRSPCRRSAPRPRRSTPPLARRIRSSTTTYRRMLGDTAGRTRTHHRRSGRNQSRITASHWSAAEPRQSPRLTIALRGHEQIPDRRSRPHRVRTHRASR